MTNRPRLLTDEPSVKDLLGGAHEKIASTIVTLLQTSPGGQTIRLDGVWGSGKSSVVRMVTEHLETTAPTSASIAADKNPGFSVFLYDAWVHSGDPLRRAFLAALVAKLTERRWLADGSGNTSVDFWNTKLAKLGRRLKVSTKRTKPVISRRARLVLSALAALGIATPILAELETKLVHDLSVGELALYGFLTAGIAFIVLASLSTSVLGFILRRNIDEETVETDDEPEPTSVEFQEAFGELMSAVLSNSSRRLLIVVDNLDRIDRNETQSIWALLRSFLDNPNFSDQSWFHRVWVMVPVADEKRVLLASVADAAESRDSARPSFLEKVFQLRFSLPPPMLHSWKNYLNAKLVAAFGDDITGDYDEILRLYDELKPAGPLTPRSIVSFVNELVVLKLEWGDKAPLSSLAAYLLSTDHLSEVNCKPPEAVSKILHIPDLPDTFAMLFHRASNRAEASYLSVRPRLESALDAADSESLTALFKESPAFEHVLDRFIRQDLAGLESQQERLLQALCALAPLVEGVSNVRLSSGVSTHLRHVANTTLAAGKGLRLLNPNLMPGLSAAFRVAKDEDALAEVVISLLRRLNTDESPALTKQIDAAWDGWVEALCRVLSIPAVRRIVTTDQFNPLSLPLSPESWAKLCLHVASSKHAWILQCCTSSGGAAHHLEWLRKEFVVPSPAQIELVKYHLRNGDDRYFHASAESLVDWFTAKGTTKFDEGDVTPLVLTTTGLVTIDADRSLPYLQQLMQNNILLHAYAKAGNTPNNDTNLATLFYLITYASDGIPAVRSMGDSPTGDAIDGQRRFQGSMKGTLGLNSEQASKYADVMVSLGLFKILKLMSEESSRVSMGATVTKALLTSATFREFILGWDRPDEMAKVFSETYVAQQFRATFLEHLMSCLSSVPLEDTPT